MQIKVSSSLFRRVLFFLLLIFSFSYLKGQQVKESTLSKDSILIGDQIVWETNFEVTENTPIHIANYGALLERDTTIKGRVEVVSDFVLDSLSFKEGKRLLSAKVLLTSFDSGSYNLPSPIILFSKQDGSVDTLKIDSKSLYVNNLQIDTASFTPYDIKGQMGYPFSFKQLLPMLIIFLIIAIIIFLLYKYLKYRKAKREGKYAEPPHIQALKRLDKLRSEKLWLVGKDKLFYSGITDTLKEYIEKSYGIGAVEMTSTEIMNELKNKNIEQKLYEDLGVMFSISDLVKFAKLTPQVNESEDSIQTAINFVNYTYMRQLEEEREKEREKEKENSTLNENKSKEA